MDYDQWKLAEEPRFSYCKYCGALIEDDEIMCEQCQDEQRTDFNED